MSTSATLTSPSPSPGLGSAAAETADESVLEILDIARHILDNGVDRKCRRISIHARGVTVEAEFYPEAVEPFVPEPDDVRPDPQMSSFRDIKFPGEA